MTLLDDLLSDPQLIQNVAAFASENPEIVKAAMSLLNPGDGSVGGSGGLSELLSSFQSGGLGGQVASWLGGGANEALSASQVENALGRDVLSQFAAKANLGEADAGSVLAGLLPGLVDQLTPQGQVPKTGGLDDLLGGLAGGFKLR